MEAIRYADEAEIADLDALPNGLNEPQLSGASLQGAQDFAAKCQVCHGAAVTSTYQGPPLVHSIYRPSHHGDRAFVAAVTIGPRQHHWPFANMPPVEGVSETEINNIIADVRALQVANGVS